MGQLWERRKKQEQSQWLCSQQQRSFKITQRKAANKSVSLPAGIHVQQQSPSLLLVSMPQLRRALHICALNETELH